VIPVTLDNATQGELQKYENDYKAINLITTALCRNVYDRVSHLETAHDVWLKLYNIMKAPLRLSLHVEILIIGSTGLFLRNLVNCLMITLLGVSPLSVVYVLMILLHIPIMNMLNSCYMRLMIMDEA
jgi:hypothetical protein